MGLPNHYSELKREKSHFSGFSLPKVRMENKQNVKDACSASLKTEKKKSSPTQFNTFNTESWEFWKNNVGHGNEDNQHWSDLVTPQNIPCWLNLPAFWKFTEHFPGGSTMPDTGFDLCWEQLFLHFTFPTEHFTALPQFGFTTTRTPSSHLHILLLLSVMLTFHGPGEP